MKKKVIFVIIALVVLIGSISLCVTIKYKKNKTDIDDNYKMPNEIVISTSNDFLEYEEEVVQDDSKNDGNNIESDDKQGDNEKHSSENEKKKNDVIKMLIKTNTRYSKTCGYIDGQKVYYEHVLNTYYQSDVEGTSKIKSGVIIESNKYYPKGEKQTIDMCDSKVCLEVKYVNGNDENFNLPVSGYKDLRLKFQYIVRNSGVDMIRFDTASIYVYDENNQIHGPYEIERFELSNIINRTFEDGNCVDKVAPSSLEYVYDVVSENLLSFDLNKISRIILVPYAKYDEYKDFFKWNNLTISASKEEQYKISNKKTYTVSETLLRNKVVSNMVTNATLEWSPALGTVKDPVIYTYDPNSSDDKDSNITSYNNVFRYNSNYFYYGLPYIDGIDATRNSFSNNLNKKNYIIPTKYDSEEKREEIDTSKMRGMFCSSSVYEAVSESLPMDTNLAWTKAYLTSPDVKYLGGLEYCYGKTGDSYNTENVKNNLINNIQNGKHKITSYKKVDNNRAVELAKDVIYNAYAELKPGDGVVHFTDYIPANTCKEYSSVILKQFNKKEHTYSQTLTNKGHVMLVTGKTVVVKDSKTGKIDPDKSYVVVTEITNKEGNTENRTYVKNNTSFTGKDVYSNEFNNNFGFTKANTNLKNLKDLDGNFTQWNVHRKISFRDLYFGIQCSMYVPFTFKNYNSNGTDMVQVEKASAKLVNVNSLDDFANGLKGTIIANSTIQAIKFKIESFDTTKTPTLRTVNYEYTYYPDSTMIYSLNYQGMPDEAKFIDTINTMKKNKVKYFDVTISVVLGSTVKNSKIVSDEVAVFFYKNNYYFDDMNFYGCVVDGYNEAKGTNYNYSVRLSVSDIAIVKNLSCKDRGVISTNGIDKLVNLESVDLSKNKIKSIDLSKNVNLVTLMIYDNKLKEIDLTNNKKLNILYLYKGKMEKRPLDKKYTINN